MDITNWNKLFDMSNNTDKSLARQTRQKEEYKITNIRNKRASLEAL